MAEIQGLYGPLRLPEGRFQIVWALQHLQSGSWRTVSGKSLQVHDPGQWNHGRGPDFLDARMEVEGKPVRGDVELHLYREDWWRHGHDADMAFDGVVLHVTVFPGGMPRPVRTVSGREPEEWVMGAWMREDVESVAGGVPGLYGELAPELSEWVGAEPAPAIRERLRLGADRRWAEKVAVARSLLETHGWEGALHRLMLFTMGYPRNRRAFYALGEAYPRASWREEGFLQRLRNDWCDRIDWNFGRPANRAYTRLQQVSLLNGRFPDWPERVRRLPTELPTPWEGLSAEETHDTRLFRQRMRLNAWSGYAGEEVFGGVLNASVVQQLMINLILPATVAAGLLGDALGSLLWFHSKPGPYPDAFHPLLQRLSITLNPRLPISNGWMQGLLWMEDQLRLERIRSWVGRDPPQA